MALDADPVEVEWQFDALDLRPVERWLAALPAESVDTGPFAVSRQSITAVAKTAKRLHDTYLDTAAWHMGQAGLVLRLRRRGRALEATIKSLKDTVRATEGGPRTRLEVNEMLGSEHSASGADQFTKGPLMGLGFGGPVGRRVHAVAGRRPIREVIEIRTRRRPYTIRLTGDEVGELALDETVITSTIDRRARPVSLRRVEVEVDAEWASTLAPIVDGLRETCGLQVAALSKFEAGLLGLGLAIPGPPDLGSTSVLGDVSFGELAFAVLRRHLATLLAREPGTRLGEDIEELHDMRVTTRRLRAAIDFFESVLPPRAAVLREELAWLATVLGSVRDLDVQIEHMDSLEADAAVWSDGGISPLEHLRHLLLLQRQGAREHLLDALDSPRWDRLAAGLTAMVSRGPNRRLLACRAPAVTVLPDLIEERHRAARKAARRAKRTGAIADYHRLRIRCKRLRYSVEFTSGLYGARADRFVRRLVRLQDVLGRMQDAEVAMIRLSQLATAHPESAEPLPPPTVFVMGAVAERYRSDLASTLAGLPRRLKFLRGLEWDDFVSSLERHRESAPPPAPVPVVRRTPPSIPTADLTQDQATPA